MKFDKIFLTICLIVCIFSMASVCAGDVNDMAIASGDMSQVDSSQSEKIADDNLQMVEEQVNDDEIVGDESNSDVLSANSCNYSELGTEVGSEGDVKHNTDVIALDPDKGSYTDLQSMIDNCMEDTLYLPYNITFNPDCDLASDNPYNESINFKEGMQIKRALTIDGNGFTINGLKKSRIFNITASDVVLRNITFINGNSELGGAVIFNNDVSGIAIDNCKFINNSAAKNGGALYVNGAFVNSTIGNSEFISNVATNNGGAIYIFNSSTENLFENLTFSDNRAENNDGGAINFHWELFKTRFNNVTFFKNTANKYGGAINTDQNVNDKNAYVDVDFISNKASNGGAMGGYGHSNFNSFDGCSFANNSATNNGGAVYYMGNMQSNVFENTEFIRNTAANNGGAIYINRISSENVFENLTFSDNRARNKDGGAINFHGETSKTSFSNVTFFKNAAGDSGGAINNDNNVNNENKYVNVDFINNTASKGGALNGYGQSNNNSFDGCSFANNTAANDGGAIYYKGNMKSNIFESCSFVNNVAGNNGGVIFGFRDSISNKFNKDLFINNSAANNASVIYYQGSSTSDMFNSTEFRSNSADAMNGSAIAVLSTLEGTFFNNVKFISNTGNSVIDINESDQNSIIRNSIFINNNAAILKVNSGNIQLINSWFGNNASNYNETPNAGIGLDNWLFLNATANPDEPLVNQSSSIAFKLCSYNATSGTIRDYDASEMNVELELNSTLGELNQYSALIGEEVTYSAKQPGNAEVIGKFETASYAIGLNPRNPASVDVVNSTLDLKINDTFGIVATTSPEGLPVTYNSSNVSVATVDADGNVFAVGVGSAVITVSVGGDDVYALNSTAVTVNVVKRDLNITAYSLGITGNVTLILVGFENATGNVTVTVGENIYNSSVMWGMAFVSIPQSPENVTAYIYYPGDDNYCNASTTVDIIAKKGLNITVSADPIRVGENAILIITGLENATGNVSVIVGSGFYNAPIVNGTAIATISGLNNTSTAYVLFLGDDNYDMGFASVNITVLPAKENVVITASPVTATYNINKNLVITLKDANGKVLSGVKVIVNLNGDKTYTTDKNGQIKVNVAKLVPKTYTAIITFNGDDAYSKSTKNVRVIVKKGKSKIVAKKKTFKRSKKVKKYTITLKDSKKKAIKKVKVTLKVKGKTYKAKTNAKGKATFKIKKLTKKGKFKAKITFKGNKYYNKATKKVKIVVK